MHLSYGLRRKYEISIPFVIYGEKTCVEYRTFTAESQQTAQECPFNDLFYFIWLTHLEFQYIGILFQSSIKKLMYLITLSFQIKCCAMTGILLQIILV